MTNSRQTRVVESGSPKFLRQRDPTVIYPFQPIHFSKDLLFHFSRFFQNILFNKAYFRRLLL